MRIPSLPPYIVGILGGSAGLMVHAVLLSRFFSQSHGMFQAFLELLLALLLGLAALLVAVFCRRSTKVLAVVLPVFGALGFFPRPLSWIPAGVLLMAAGATALWSVRREAKAAIPPALTAFSTDGRPLHWSEAARLGIPAASARRVVTPEAGRWSTGSKAAVIAGAVMAAAIVVPLSLGTITLETEKRSAVPTTNEGGAMTEGPGPATTTAASLPATTPPADNEPGASTTTATGPATTDEFTWYTDEAHGFGIKFPVEWRNTDPTEVGQRFYREFKEAYIDTFGAVAFADWASPTFNGCYLDFIWVEVYDEQIMEVPTLPEFRNYIADEFEMLEASVGGVERVEPLRDVDIAGMRGLRHVWSILYGGHKLLVMECVLVGEERAYFLQFAAVEDDWTAYRPLFEEILREFTVSVPGPLT